MTALKWSMSTNATDSGRLVAVRPLDLGEERREQRLAVADAGQLVEGRGVRRLGERDRDARRSPGARRPSRPPPLGSRRRVDVELAVRRCRSAAWIRRRQPEPRRRAKTRPPSATRRSSPATIAARIDREPVVGPRVDRVGHGDPDDERGRPERGAPGPRADASRRQGYAVGPVRTVPPEVPAGADRTSQPAVRRPRRPRPTARPPAGSRCYTRPRPRPPAGSLRQGDRPLLEEGASFVP